MMDRVCVYDNPSTMMREVWENGEMIYAVSALDVNKHQEGTPFTPGNVVGEHSAMAQVKERFEVKW